MKSKVLHFTIIALLWSGVIDAQTPLLLMPDSLADRVSAAPESVFEMFRKAGMNPVNHPLTSVEKMEFQKAIAILPPLHQRILKKHLHNISFMDSMPNNALTSTLESVDSMPMFNITFRAGILSETISEWATKKEYSSFDRLPHTNMKIVVNAGIMNAINYVLLHEATHVVDAVVNFTPHFSDRNAIVQHTPFTKGNWHKLNIPVRAFSDSLLEQARLRNGSVSKNAILQVYAELKKTPFASLYAMAAWFEDAAELLTIYHLTNKMHQPFRISIKRDNVEVAGFSPMHNKLVKRRVKYLKIFYKNDTPT